MSLLDLPDGVLEMILIYCRGEQLSHYKETPLLNLTLCNKFLKNFIETNPRLIERLSLKLPYEHNKNSEGTERKSKICLNSTRKYTSVVVQCGGKTKWEIKDNCIEISGKPLLDKHAETMKKVDFCFSSIPVTSNIVLEILQYLENQINVEYVGVKFIDHLTFYHEEIWNCFKENESDYDAGVQLSENSSYPNKFARLKHLKIDTESSVVFSFFNHCKSVEILELIKFGSKNVNLMEMMPLLKNSRATLHTLIVEFDSSSNVSARKMEYFLKILMDSEVNLKKIDINLHPIKFNVGVLLDFLKTQNKLEELEIKGIFDKTFVGKLGRTVGDFVKLKKVHLHFATDQVDRSRFGVRVINDPQAFEWNSHSLEELKISSPSQHIPEIIFLTACHKLKKIDFGGGVLKFGGNFFSDLTMNYQNLVELSVVCSICNYSSNDIFLILKHLKNLKVLKFKFPESSQLDANLFNDNEDLNLPKVHQVELIINYSVSVDHFTKLLHTITNLSKFHFSFWKFYNEKYLDRITKELPNLRDLWIHDLAKNLNYIVLQKISSNVQEFNNHPNSFKINEKDIDYWIENASKYDCNYGYSRNQVVGYTQDRTFSSQMLTQTSSIFTTSISAPLNFDNLPDHVLEKIVSYCKEWTLLRLTVTSKFFKEFIENNPRLMRRLVLKLPNNHTSLTSNPETKIHLALNSERKYTSASVCYGNSNIHYEIDIKSLEVNGKILLDKHAETVKNIKFSFSSTQTNATSVFLILKYLENLVNVEYVEVEFKLLEFFEIVFGNIFDGGRPFRATGNVSFPNQFKQLKHLKMKVESEVVFYVFKNCKSIEILELISFGKEHVDFSDLLVLLRNCRETLHTLKVPFENDYIAGTVIKLLQILNGSEIDLKSFYMDMSSIQFEFVFILFLEFLTTQKNLEMLDLDDMYGSYFERVLENAMENQVKLKKLRIGINCKLFGNVQFPRNWTLRDLEELELNSCCYVLQIPDSMVCSFNTKLKKINFSGSVKLCSNFFENVSSSYKHLIVLKVATIFNTNYLSNDILWILKYLKKLKVLEFVFPERGQLDPDLFNNGDLNLPEIENVTLFFNHFVTLYYAVKFLQLMSNMSEFRFRKWINYTVNYLDIVTRELPNLANLHINETFEEMEYLNLLKIRMTIEEFNRKPETLRINEQKMSHWMEMSKKYQMRNLKDRIIRPQPSMPQLKLLQLPDRVLEEIFFYCRFNEQTPLLNLMRCNKFLKNFIETNPRLMERITLDLPLWKTYDDRTAARLINICLDSKRRYSTAAITYSIDDQNFQSTIKESGKVLVDKHAGSIKEVKFYFLDPYEEDAVHDILGYLENLKNVENVSLTFEEDSDSTGDEESESSYDAEYQPPENKSFPNKFGKLKHLAITGESPTAYLFFNHCKNLETLELSEFDWKNATLMNLMPLLKNSRETLHTLEIESSSTPLVSARKMKLFLTILKNSEIKLKKIYLNLPPIKFNVSALLDFLKTQKDLEKLFLVGLKSENFDSNLESVIGDLVNLKDVEISLLEFEKEESVVSFEWNSRSLEEFKISGYSISDLLFLSAPDKLKKITFEKSVKFGSDFFENLAKNYQNLVELSVGKFCVNYSSNDIFWILQFLKKLKVLEFVFPKNSQLSTDLLAANRNLISTEIDDVTFVFNNVITTKNATKLIQFMSKVTKFSFEYWRNCNNEYLDCITRELPNLTHLVNEYDFELENEEDETRFVQIGFAVLQKIKSNILKFNTKPRLFRINGKDIDCLMEDEKSCCPPAKKFKTTDK